MVAYASLCDNGFTAQLLFLTTFHDICSSISATVSTKECLEPTVAIVGLCSAVRLPRVINLY